MEEDAPLRAAMLSHLESLRSRVPSGALPSAAINDFWFRGRQVRLVVQNGIRKPAGLEAALTIRTTFTPPSQPPPYVDDLGADGLVRYKYRGADPQHSDNRALRAAMRQGVPLAYFVGIADGVYEALAPVWIVDETPSRLEFAVAVDAEQRALPAADLAWPGQREYALRITRQRLHQPVFRTRVLHAYQDTCAVCRLRHAELLDAAHIVADGQDRGDPVVPNGLALCKIHHAAYDRNILGVRPDLVVEIKERLLAEIDGPMLRHGLQEMNGERLTIPRARAAQPDPARLELRYRDFRAAS